MTSLIGCLNSHLLCMGSEKKKTTEKPSSCEHELTILMPQRGCLMLSSLCLLQTESLVQKFISALESAGSSGAQLNSGDRVPVSPLKTQAALTGN